MLDRSEVEHNSQNIYFRSPIGAAEAGTKVRLGIRLKTKQEIRHVLLRLWHDKSGEKLVNLTTKDDSSKAEKFYCVDMEMPEKGCLLWYYFIITTAQTFRLPPVADRILYVLDLICTLVFTMEYALRLWTADLLYPKKQFPWLRFILSPAAIIDLFSFLPFYLTGLVPAGMVVFRLIRVARILRLFRINRFLDPVAAILSVLQKKASLLFASFFLVFVLMFSSSLLMYYAEHEAQPQIFENAFSGLWWAVSTLSTTGYGDIYPITPLGRFMAIIITLLGMCLVAIPTGIITAGFMEAGHETTPEGAEDSKD